MNLLGGFYIKDKNNKKYHLLKIIILIILLIISILISFETGEKIYYLINTSYGIETQVTKSNMASWRFKVIIKY